jgi:hypothetical protein
MSGLVSQIRLDRLGVRREAQPLLDRRHQTAQKLAHIVGALLPGSSGQPPGFNLAQPVLMLKITQV